MNHLFTIFFFNFSIGRLVQRPDGVGGGRHRLRSAVLYGSTAATTDAYHSVPSYLVGQFIRRREIWLVFKGVA